MDTKGEQTADTSNKHMCLLSHSYTCSCPRPSASFKTQTQTVAQLEGTCARCRPVSLPVAGVDAPPKLNAELLAPNPPNDGAGVAAGLAAPNPPAPNPPNAPPGVVVLLPNRPPEAAGAAAAAPNRPVLGVAPKGLLAAGVAPNAEGVLEAPNSDPPVEAPKPLPPKPAAKHGEEDKGGHTHPYGPRQKQSTRTVCLQRSFCR